MQASTREGNPRWLPYSATILPILRPTERRIAPHSLLHQVSGWWLHGYDMMQEMQLYFQFLVIRISYRRSLAFSLIYMVWCWLFSAKKGLVLSTMGPPNIGSCWSSLWDCTSCVFLSSSNLDNAWTINLDSGIFRSEAKNYNIKYPELSSPTRQTEDRLEKRTARQVTTPLPRRKKSPRIHSI